ncbi:hypothetical protein ACVBIO_02965 [Shewanella sp. 0m-8]
MDLTSLHQLNDELDTLLDKLNTVPAEDETTDELVSYLQELVGKRQSLLVNAFKDATAADAVELKKQITLSQSFEAKANMIKAHRQSLLHAGRKSKQQLNMYKTIDSNR